MEDLAKLDSIDDSVVLGTLQQRYDKDEIYTRNGAVLIAINPYKRVDATYSAETLHQYKSALALEREPPHIFSVAAAAHRTMIGSGRSQAVVISGESGAGKTESARFVLQYLRNVSNSSDELERRIYNSQPLTEAFGCAKTLRNDNSSRFGKFLKLHFDVSAKIKGASLSTYLLEKSRVVFVSPGERSYHIFYAILRGIPEGERKKLQLASADPKTYKYLASGETGEAGGGLQDKQNFAIVKDGLQSQGLSSSDIDEVCQLLAGILNLGSVVFDPSKTDTATVTAASSSALGASEAVLGLHPQSLAKALTKRKIKAGNEWVEQDLSYNAAIDGRDALSKAIYSRLFDRLIAKINAALSAGQEAHSAEDRIIGIVDIFGFEVFQSNSLEQLCINFANEKLQALFTKTVFIETIEAYKQDGIDAAEIKYVDNAPLIELFETPKTGLWALLTEECMIPKGSDAGFCEKVHAAHPKSQTLQTLKGSSRSEGFMIEHFAGAVGYSTKFWLDKNKDPLNGDLVVLMQFSDNATLRAIFGEGDAPSGPGQKFKSNKFQGIINTFRVQLQELNTILDESDRHFVRCFKPNDVKKPDNWDPAVITRQLHTSGVLDALRVARTGFPDRMAFAEFVSTFSIIVGGEPKSKQSDPPKQRCADLLPKLNIAASACKMGNERVFLSAGTLDRLKTRRIEAMAGVAIKLQSAARGMSARKLARKTRKERLERLEKIESLMKTEDVEGLREAIMMAKAVGAQFSPGGLSAMERAEARLKQLEKELAERLAAGKALEAAMAGHDAEKLRGALAEAKRWAVDAGVVSKAAARLQKLEEEEERRRQEEARLAAVAAAEREAAKKKLEEERMERQRAEDKRRREEEANEQASAAAAKEAKEAADAQQKAQAEAEAERKALEEEEAMRKRVLARLDAEDIRFRSGPEDVLEYAVYLGMQLEEDIQLLWIADEALQAEDPEGWDQCESPNGDMYYMHEVTKQVLWQHPLDYTYQQKYLAAKAGTLSKGDAPASSGPPMPPQPPTSGSSAAAVPDPAANYSLPKDVSAVSEEDLVAVVQKLLGTKHADLRTLLVEPSCSMAPMRCYVNRHKSRMGGTKFDFFMSISANKDMYCFTGKKQPVARGCYYSIALDQDESKRSKGSGESFIGKVRSDKRSVEYTLYDDGVNPDGKEKGPLRRELLMVNFINSLRNRNPGAMEVIVPSVDDYGNTVAVQPDASNPEGLQEKLAKGKLQNTVVFKNREPKWNKESNMYQLDFQGRATLASCKNIQLAPKDGNDNDVRFLMGKVHDNTFNVDFAKPFSALQAFAFALIVFDNSSGSF